MLLALSPMYCLIQTTRSGWRIRATRWRARRSRPRAPSWCRSASMTRDYRWPKVRRARLALVTPSHQSPLGVALSLRRRLALLSWASAADAFVIEDDYDSEFRY